jgi:hypothetical protein
MACHRPPEWLEPEPGVHLLWVHLFPVWVSRLETRSFAASRREERLQAKGCRSDSGKRVSNPNAKAEIALHTPIPDFAAISRGKAHKKQENGGDSLQISVGALTLNDAGNILERL